ncbi:MAG: phosphoribosylformylglycinamidine cyclo-ligase [Coxiellaceae bacterium]|nr:phosphoribosylformylglycinamidine cyclo-ligase [Coxiellaceae bacterium]|tara:strand:+ start:10485 stop:11543 length:1059 start_codon:yes stop_codon:yes gene_type:complete
MNHLTNTTHPLSYKAAGVDTKKAHSLIERIKPLAHDTLNSNVLAGIGGFGAMFELPIEEYPQPILVSGTDGVGTKLILAHHLDRHDTIGIDLVAMCVNDILCQGAKPLYFLDYYATGSLNVAQAEAVVSGIARGCQDANMALIGGETAEMPGMYDHDHYDLAGFCVGIVNKPDIITTDRVEAGDALIGISSSGPHANGYSLIRKIIEQTQPNLNTAWNRGVTLADALLAPTKIYARTIQTLQQHIRVHAIAHITGGGLTENLPRTLPNHLKAAISSTAWEWPAIFQWLQQAGRLTFEEMINTFNCGIGMILTVNAKDVEKTLHQLTISGESAHHLGYVVSRSHEEASIQWVN